MRRMLLQVTQVGTL
ncbi:UNVERIFIED_CONTAM: hypothetical protein GTU68_019360 [Idotea baltica]|nr:hypothetical protein [Idotea baltica]